MIYTKLTNKAMRVAYEAHHGQVDKGGVPYIFHPMHLAEQMQDEMSTCAALLHDVVEDTNVTIEDLAAEFPEEVVKAVSLLTHNEEVSYQEYIAKIKENPIARAVKLADLVHNQDESRLEGSEKISEETRERLKDKYSKAMALLVS